MPKTNKKTKFLREIAKKANQNTVPANKKAHRIKKAGLIKRDIIEFIRKIMTGFNEYCCHFMVGSSSMRKFLRGKTFAIDYHNRYIATNKNNYQVLEKITKDDLVLVDSEQTVFRHPKLKFLTATPDFVKDETVVEVKSKYAKKETFSEYFSNSLVQNNKAKLSSETIDDIFQLRTSMECAGKKKGKILYYIFDDNRDNNSLKGIISNVILYKIVNIEVSGEELLFDQFHNKILSIYAHYIYPSIRMILKNSGILKKKEVFKAVKLVNSELKDEDFKKENAINIFCSCTSEFGLTSNKKTYDFSIYEKMNIVNDFIGKIKLSDGIMSTSQRENCKEIIYPDVDNYLKRKIDRWINLPSSMSEKKRTKIEEAYKTFLENLEIPSKFADSSLSSEMNKLEFFSFSGEDEQ